MLLQHLKSSFYATFVQSRKEYEQQVANEEAEQLRSFQVSVLPTNCMFVLFSPLSNVCMFQLEL
jgi:hypothetical protein